MEEKDVVIKIHRKGLKYYNKSEIPKIKKHPIIYFGVKSSKLISKLRLNVVALISTPV